MVLVSTIEVIPSAFEGHSLKWVGHVWRGRGHHWQRNMTKCSGYLLVYFCGRSVRQERCWENSWRYFEWLLRSARWCKMLQVCSDCLTYEFHSPRLKGGRQCYVAVFMWYVAVVDVIVRKQLFRAIDEQRQITVQLGRHHLQLPLVWVCIPWLMSQFFVGWDRAGFCTAVLRKRWRDLKFSAFEVARKFVAIVAVVANGVEVHAMQQLSIPSCFLLLRPPKSVVPIQRWKWMGWMLLSAVAACRWNLPT